MTHLPNAYGEHCPLLREELVEKIKPHVSDKRWQHILRVETEAVALARRYGVDEVQAALAALVHDYAKNRPLEEMRAAAKEQGLPDRYTSASGAILHGVIGASYIRDELHVQNEAILEAVRQHTIGGVEMSELSKVLFVADYIEAGRAFEGVEEARRLAQSSLDEAVRYKIKMNMEYLVSKGAYIFPDAVEVYNAHIPKMR